MFIIIGLRQSGLSVYLKKHDLFLSTYCTVVDRPNPHLALYSFFFVVLYDNESAVLFQGLFTHAAHVKLM